jgi:hypothetical protein
MRNFDQEQTERAEGLIADKQSLAFTLGGRVLYRNPEPPADALFILGQITPDSSDASDLEAVRDVILGMVLPESTEAYREALVHGDPKPSIRTLMDVMRWMIGESTSRPTLAPSPSTNGGGATGTPSTPPAGSEASTSAAFPSVAG